MKKLQFNIYIFFQFIKKLYFFRQVSLIKQQHNFLIFFLCIILFFLLIKSSFFLIFYLICWNLFPFTQYFLFYNPLNYELYLRILCLCIMGYSYIILKRFPIQFKFYSWIFQQINIYNLFIKNNYMTYKLYFLIILYNGIFLILFLYKNHYILYLFWISLIVGEIFIFIKIKYSFNNLYIIKKLQKYYDLKNENLQDILKTTIFSAEENNNFYNTYLINYNPEDEAKVASFGRQNEETMLDTEEITEDEFEEFFLDYNIIPLSLNDLADNELNTKTLINWFWIKFWIIQLLLLSLVNIIICFLIVSFGIPENWIYDIQIYQYEDKILLEDYQNRTNLLVNQNYWGSTWRWYLTGIFTGSSLLYFFNSKKFFFDTNKVSYNYTKYISYRNATISRKSFIYDQLFFFYNYVNEIATFIEGSRSAPHPFRETFLYKYYLYEDLQNYQSFKTLLYNDNNMLFNWGKKIEIMTWLFQKTKTWVKNYYYAAPAIQKFPDYYYKWLELYRLIFVMDELFDTNSILQKLFWFMNKKWHNKESGNFFLEDLFFNEFSPERYFDNLDLRNLDQGIFTHILPKKHFNQFKYHKFFTHLDDNDDYSAEVEDNIVSYYHYYPKFRKLLQLYYSKAFFKTQEFLAAYSPFTYKKHKKELFKNYLLNFKKYKLQKNLETFFKADSYNSLSDVTYDNIYNIYGYHDILNNYLQSKNFEITNLEYFYLYDEYKKFLKKWYNSNEYYNVNYYFDQLQSVINFFKIVQMGAILPIQKTEIGDPVQQFNFKKLNKYEFSTLEDLDDSLLMGEDIEPFLINEVQDFTDTDFFINEKNFINNFFNQANNDILSELYFENNTSNLQNSNLFNYQLRSDFQKTTNRKREFIYQDLLQLYTYSASHFIELKKDRLLQPLYNINKKFLNYTTMYTSFPDYKDYAEYYGYQILFDKKDFLKTFGYYYKEADFLNLSETSAIWTDEWLENYYQNNTTYFDQLVGKVFDKLFRDSSKIYWSIADSLGTHQDYEIYLKNLIWYKYYYKVDAVLNYFDYMPSYRNFYMETWPNEYLLDVSSNQNTFLGKNFFQQYNYVDSFYTGIDNFQNILLYLNW